MAAVPERPFITLSYAQSLDGCIAAQRGSPLAISSPASLRMTHELRAAHDAILVGIGTVLADDPQLTVRFVKGENPQPIVLDSHLRFPRTARLMENVKKPWIVAVEGIDGSLKRSLEAEGARIIPVLPGEDGRVSLPALLDSLGTMGIKRLMVEGGAQVITAFLRERLVNEMILTVSPVFVGGQHAVESLLTGVGNFPRLEPARIESCGPDWIIRGKLT